MKVGGLPIGRIAAAGALVAGVFALTLTAALALMVWLVLS
jgi:hypothetical protein